MAEKNEITPAQAANIQVANADEIAALNEQVLGTTAALTQADRELEMLNESLNQLAYTKQNYDKNAETARRAMQRLIPSL